MTPDLIDALAELALTVGMIAVFPLGGLAVVRMLDYPERAALRRAEKARLERWEAEAPLRLRKQQKKDREHAHALWMEQYHALGGCTNQGWLKGLRGAAHIHLPDCPTCKGVPAVETPRRHLRSITSRKAS